MNQMVLARFSKRLQTDNFQPNALLNVKDDTKSCLFMGNKCRRDGCFVLEMNEVRINYRQQQIVD